MDRISRLAPDLFGEGRQMTRIGSMGGKLWKARGATEQHGQRVSRPRRIDVRHWLAHGSARRLALIGALAAALLPFIACTYKVQVEAPKEPIVIDLNVKIEHEVRIRVEKDIDELIDERQDLFGGAQ
jgi:hypothetical protein